jgi:hypothetical protein
MKTFQAGLRYCKAARRSFSFFDLGTGILTLLVFIGSGCLNLSAQPVITSFSPTSGPVGTHVIISGSNFNSDPSENIVFFGATKAAVNSASTTSLDVTVPAGATYQPVSVTNLADHLTAYSSKPFDVTFPFCESFDSTSFSPKIDLPAGPFPNDLKVCDFDGDGKPDLIVLRYDEPSFSVFKNTSSNGIISFDPKVDFSAGSQYEYPDIIIINDFDGDGKPDVALSDGYDSIVSVFRNISTPGVIAFAPGVVFFVGSHIYEMASGDLDKDGKPDLVFNSNYNDNLMVLRNVSSAGNISFAPPQHIETVGFGAISICDMDGDGKPDITIANNEASNVSIFLNTSTSGSISFDSGHTFPSGGWPNSISTSDLDGDGKPDIITGNDNPSSYSILRNISSVGNVAFSSKVDYPVSEIYSFSVGDVDGNGKPDMVLVNYPYNYVSVYINTSVPGNISFAPNVNFNTGINPAHLAIADLDGDGKPDLAISNILDSTISLLRNHTMPPAPEICIVTVDSTSTNNVVYWDKTLFDHVDSVIVYRETTTNIYKRIGAVSNNAPGLFVDTIRQRYFPYTGNPNVGSYRYKLQIRDTCGNYSELGPYHNTIFISHTGSLFSWNNYEIEGQPVPLPQLLSYQLFRDTDANGNWMLVAGVSGNQLALNDPDYSTWPNALRRVEAIWSTNCLYKESGNISRSNITGLKPNGVFENNGISNYAVSVSPNPFSVETVIQTSHPLINASLKVYDINGKLVRQINNITGQSITLFRDNLPGGLYFIKLLQENKMIAEEKVAIID